MISVKSTGPGLQSRVALVTGASRGIGRAISERLASEGAAVLATDVAHLDELEDVVQSIRAAGGRAAAAHGDVSVEGDMIGVASAAREHFGGIDILVNNAAIVDAHQPWHEVTIDRWERIQAVNMTGCLLTLRACHDDLVRSPAGRIVNVSSITALTGQAPLLSYATSKGAMLAFTRSLARELGAEGITVNAVLPGAIQTEAERELFGDMGIDEDVFRTQAVRRRGTADDVAAAVAFLASDDASFITGQSVIVDGGWLMH